MTDESKETGDAVDNSGEHAPRLIHDRLFNPITACLASACLVASFFLPCDGLGITVCWFKWMFALPCPGCGLTRSVTCISHLEFSKAWSYHPFGPLIYLLFVANCVLVVLPRPVRCKLRAMMGSNERRLGLLYMIVVGFFLTYGCLRILFIALET